MREEVGAKAKNGFKWTIIKTIFNSVVQPFYRILLAVLLIPSEFAYIAVIALIASLAELLNNVGIGEAIIRKEKVPIKDLSSLYFFNLIITSIISIMVFFNAGNISNYYSMEKLTLIIQTMALVVLANGSTSLFKFYLHKEFQFKFTTIAQVIKLIVEITISAPLILFGFGIWGYMWGIVLSTILHSILLSYYVYTKTDFRIVFYFSFSNLKKYLNFGIFISGKKILSFGSHKIDEIIIGGIFSAEVLGTYYLAKNILLQLQTLITVSFGQVLLPLFSKISHDLKSLKTNYIKIISVVTLFSLPLFLGVVLTSKYFVPIFFGEGWDLSIQTFQLLAIPMVTEVLSAGIMSSVLYSQNKVRLAFNIELFFTITYGLILYIYKFTSLFEVTLIYALYIVLKFIVNQYCIGNILKINFNDYSQIFKSNIIATFLMGIVVGIMQSILVNSISDVSILVFSIFIGILTYGFVQLKLNESFISVIYKSFKKPRLEN